ncbi:MAG: quinone-dependent dihydroorotate dehydrogenase [Acetobacteraceae bacterium]|nr:quinone-dependent dihydroorotate dehydrogenase [Acetobacteraceae bacterium]
MTPELASACIPLLRWLDPETAHGLALHALRLGLAGRASVVDARLEVHTLGLRFANPLGLAAGFDKNAVALQPLAKLGFGFVEAGTVTPRPQPGNPRPRLFRLMEDRAAINRMGFNNDGLETYLANLERRPHTLPVGGNIGINKEGADPERDYPLLVKALARKVDYIVINVSSPNTPGLRDLQGEARLRSILAAIAESVPDHPPLLVKIAPDLAFDGLESVVEAAIAGGAAGLIVSNTTIARPKLLSTHANQAGGLSGAPLFGPSTEMLRRAAKLAAGRLVLIGVGGVASGADILTKLRAGASLVQVYTALAFEGPGLIPRLLHELQGELTRHGFASVEAAIGADL